MYSYLINEVGAVFTNCLFPEFTRRAMESVLDMYPSVKFTVVDDHCIECEEELAAIEKDFNVEVLRNSTRVGTGRSIDRALRFLQTPWLLTVDHGVELREPGLLEFYLEQMRSNPQWIGIGLFRDDKRCNRAFGPYIDPVFSLWDGEFILMNQENGFTFALTHVRIGNWQVDGCSTAQFLQYRALRLGKSQGYIGKDVFTDFIRHHMTPRTRGRCASPHELMIVEEDYLSPRLRNPDGSLQFPGIPFDR